MKNNKCKINNNKNVLVCYHTPHKAKSDTISSTKSKENNECKLGDKNNQCKLNDNKNTNKFTIKLYKNLFHSDKGVHELVYKDFDIQDKKIFLNNSFFSNNKGFILFYAPWCKHCKIFKKEYEELASDYIQMFPFGSINIENIKDGNDKLKVMAKIDSVPQLMVVTKNGFIQRYDSTYDYDDLLYYINVNS